MQSQPHNNTCTHTLTFKPHTVIIIFFPISFSFVIGKYLLFVMAFSLLFFLFFIIHCRTLSFASTERVSILYRLPFRFSPISRAVECTEKKNSEATTSFLPYIVTV